MVRTEIIYPIPCLYHVSRPGGTCCSNTTNAFLIDFLKGMLYETIFFTIPIIRGMVEERKRDLQDKVHL